VNGSTKLKWGEQEIDWTNWQRFTMREAIIHYWPEAAGAKPEMSDFTSFDDLTGCLNNAVSSLQNAMDNQPDTTAGVEERVRLTFRKVTLKSIAHELEIGRNIGKTIASVFEAVAEEHLTQPTIIYEFPTAVSPLSKQKPDEPEWTERFEIYAGQMEISNGFSELNDPEDQRRRFEAQLEERERGDDEAHQMDEDYIRALSYGMPPAGGVGVGVDRLAMLLTDSQTIRDVILFPLLRPEKSQSTEGEEKVEKKSPTEEKKL
jgi:lysyl-tRNA synthetase class 2